MKGLEAQHLEVRLYGGAHLILRPVFANADYFEAEAPEFWLDSRLSSGEICWPERTLGWELAAVGNSDDGLGVAQLSGGRVPHQEVARPVKTVACEEVIPT